MRGALVPIALSFQWLKDSFAPSFGADRGIIYAGVLLGAVTLAISIWALNGLEDTFHKDLDYIET